MSTMMTALAQGQERVVQEGAQSRGGSSAEGRGRGGVRYILPRATWMERERDKLGDRARPMLLLPTDA